MCDANPRIATGLCDSNGEMIHVGDMVRKEVTCNKEFHGAYALYRVKQQGIVPYLSYLQSEKGVLLPDGYLAVPLSDEYDQKLFLFTTDASRLRPVNLITVEK